MSEPFLAEIRIVGFDFAPRGWAYCDGQILPINQNQSLYSLLGTTYGGDGRMSFALPDLRSRTPIHKGGNFQLGNKGGQETHTLTAGEMAGHTHAIKASGNEGTTEEPSNSVVLAKAAGGTLYGAANNLVNMAAFGNSGGGQGHNNMQPYCTLGFCIALQGLFPSRN